ncbi:MAG: gamma-glutamylcyclotransferase family protein [Acidimicrobiales bacterium]
MHHPLDDDLRRCRHLAVYGTLMFGERNHSTYLGSSLLATSGTIGGRLVEVPALTTDAYPYPALLPGSDRVVVHVFEVTQPEVLASVDRLELEVDDDGRPEYERLITTVRADAGEFIDAWCYHYRWPIPAHWRPIPGGDWRARLR